LTHWSTNGNLFYVSRTATVLAALMSGTVLAVTACGGSSSDSSGVPDQAAISEAANHYFVFDRTPDADEYCTSYVELQRSDSFGHGDLASDANRTESHCRQFLPRYVRHGGHTGWRNTQIKRISIDGDRGHVLVSFRMRGRQLSRDAWVGRVAAGDWRILNAGYD
jgi:hypothetical protein